MNQGQKNQQWTEYIETNRQPSSLEKLDCILEKRLKAFAKARQPKGLMLKVRL